MAKAKEAVQNEDMANIQETAAEKPKTKKPAAKAKDEVKKTTTEAAEETAKAGQTVAQQKAEAIISTVRANNINGIRYIEVDDNNKIFESRFLIEGQALHMFIVVNSTVYSYIHVHLVTITPEKLEKCSEYLNRLNDSFPMLKYFINDVGNVVLTCSLPSTDDKFDPALVFALVDQVKAHLEDNYKVLMQKIWEE